MPAGGLEGGVDEVGSAVVDDHVGAEGLDASTFAADVVTTTWAPIAFTIWIAAVPTPEAPACTSAPPPEVSPTTSAS